MKYKIINKSVDVTDEEIDSFKNFEDVLNKYDHAVEKAVSNKTKWHTVLWLLGGLFLAVTTVFYFYPSKKAIDISRSNVKNDTSINIVSDNINKKLPSEIQPEPTSTLLEEEEEEVVVDNKVHAPNKSAGEVVEVEVNQAEKARSASQPPVQNSDFLFIEAEPIIGLSALYDYFESTLEYPIDALSDSVQGSVIIQFTINKEGLPQDIVVEKPLGELFDKQAISVIENMPKWKPATINGNPVNSKINVPLHFNFKHKQ